MIGENLKRAQEWFDKAITYDQAGNVALMEKCLNRAIQLEKEGIKAGESWN